MRKERVLLLVSDGGFTTRIHLDRVEGLGDFMELEVVLKDGQSDANGADVANRLMQALGLGRAERISGAYLDLCAATLRADAP